MSDLTDTVLGQYRLMEVIGRGSTSTVYKAHQPSLNRYVAIKVLLRNLDPQFESRFRREAQAIAQLQHPNILPIYDYGQQGGLHYFVLQYIENGSTLNDLVVGEPIEPVQALNLVGRLLDALDYAHRRGIIHRDIKPSNVLMPLPDWPMLADFGIAKLIDDSQHLTPVGQTVGTAAYMAPERAEGITGEVDARADIYSAGVVLYELVTGHVPFDATTPLAVLMKHVHEPLPPPRSLNPALPEVVEQVLFRALEKHPAARYQTALEMAQEVRRAMLEIERAQVLKELMVGQVEPLAAPASRYTTLKLPPVREPIALNASPPHARPVPSRPPAPAAPAQRPMREPSTGGRIAAVALVMSLSAALLALFGLGGLSRLTTQANRPTESAPAIMATEVAPTAEPGTAPATATPPRPTLIPAPTVTPALPTSLPEPTAPQPAEPTPPVQSGDTTTLALEDSAWQGGYRSRSGQYGGRTATWIYGSATEYNTMRATFEASAQPVGTASLSIEGMDSENTPRTLISITVNGVEIFNGPNPLPDDDHPLETGTWTSYTWTFDAALLGPGLNEIGVRNLEPGAFGIPPFFMLDYATVTYTTP